MLYFSGPNNTQSHSKGVYHDKDRPPYTLRRKASTVCQGNETVSYFTLPQSLQLINVHVFVPYSKPHNTEFSREFVKLICCIRVRIQYRDTNIRQGLYFISFIGKNMNVPLSFWLKITLWQVCWMYTLTATIIVKSYTLIVLLCHFCYSSYRTPSSTKTMFKISIQ